MSAKKTPEAIAIPSDMPISEEGSWQIFGRLLRENYAANRGIYPLAVACLLIVGGASALMAWLVRDIVNEVLLAEDTSLVYWVAFTFAAAYIVRGVANYSAKVLMGRIGNSMVATYQSKTYQHLLKLGLDFYSQRRSGYLVGQLNENINSVRGLLVQVLSGATRESVKVIGLVGVMIALEPLLTFISLLAITLAGVSTRFLVKRMKRKALDQTRAIAKVASRFQDTVQNIAIVKAFTLEDRFSQDAGTEIRLAEKRSNSTVKVDSATAPIMDALAGISIAALLVFVGIRASNGTLDPGSFLAFLTAAIMVYDPIRRLLGLRVNFERVITNARMIEAILDTPPRQADKADATDLNVSSARVDFDEVSFSYSADDDARPIVEKVNLSAMPGKITALVGASGSGKSTLLSLLLRFYDLHDGRIMIDGQNIADVTAHSLRHNIAYVSQAPVLFEGTIADNIAYGARNAGREQIEEAAKAAFAHEFITELPKGYDTELGEQRTNLSGGQRQRLSIARAILRDAPVLLLDEATSALDNESEAKVQAAIDALARSRTTIVVAHRLSTIQNADRIYVMSDGKIVEEGRHAELIGRDGAYSQFHALQSRNAT